MAPSIAYKGENIKHHVPRVPISIPTLIVCVAGIQNEDKIWLKQSFLTRSEEVNTEARVGRSSRREIEDDGHGNFDD